MLAEEMRGVASPSDRKTRMLTDVHIFFGDCYLHTYPVLFIFHALSLLGTIMDSRLFLGR